MKYLYTPQDVAAFSFIATANRFVHNKTPKSCDSEVYMAGSGN